MNITRKEFLTLSGATAVSACAIHVEAEWPGHGADGELQEVVASARAKHGLPALSVLVAHNGAVAARAVDGVRVLGRADQAQSSDLWHIGSCTKAMTATLVALQIEHGRASWDSTLGEIFPERADAMHERAGAITLWQLFSHSAGLPENPSFAEDEGAIIGDMMEIIASSPDVVSQRLMVVGRILERAPLVPPGSAFSYSNTGYIIGGAVCERLGGAPFEQLLAEHVWRPLGITSAGFGAPQGSHAPWGHAPVGGGASPTPMPPNSLEADNPAFFAPAGGVHITLADWARFANEHVSGARGAGNLLPAAAYERLHAPALESSVYAMGWGSDVRDGQVALLTHNGSNGLWFADIRIFPKSGHVFLTACNDGRERIAEAAFDDVRAVLMQRFALN